MTDRARLGFFVIALYRALGHIPFYGSDQFFRPLGVDRASGYGHDTVAMLCIEPYHVFPVLIHADGDLSFLAIAVRAVAFNGDRHVNVQPADFTQSVLNDGAFV